MPHDAPDEPAAPTEDQMVRWLRALADAVERDPDLAARVAASTQGASEGQHDSAWQAISPSDPRGAEPPRSKNEPLRAEDGSEQGIESPQVEPSLIQSMVAEPIPEPIAIPAETIAPTLRHTRRSSRYGAPSVAGRPAELGTGVPDPFALFTQSGEAGLRRALEAVRIGTLRAIIRAHTLDPQGKLAPSATEKRLIAVIIAAAKRGTEDAAPSKSATTTQPGIPKKKRAAKHH